MELSPSKAPGTTEEIDVSPVYVAMVRLVVLNPSEGPELRSHPGKPVAPFSLQEANAARSSFFL